ncbi:MAG: hypothetical protein AAB599_00090 [Patescibacteria group bacterium]
MRNFRITKKQILIQIILLSILGLSMYLVGQRTFLKNKANEEVGRALEVKDAHGNPLDCSGGSCETKTLDVEIRLDKGKLEE